MAAASKLKIIARAIARERDESANQKDVIAYIAKENTTQLLRICMHG